MALSAASPSHREVIRRGQNSDTESVENGISDVMEVEVRGSGVDMVLQL